jgi:hypothetical protein
MTACLRPGHELTRILLTVSVVFKSEVNEMNVMVRYKVKADSAQENERLIQAVFAELARARPPGLRYQSFKLDDGVSFVHIASVDTADGSNPLLAVEEFKRFTKDIQARCVEPPVTTTLTVVGSFT